MKLFPASRIAEALGRSREAVSRDLRGVVSREFLVVRGQKTRGYAVDDLPFQMQADLRALAHTCGMSVEAFLGAPTQAWEPACGSKHVSSDDREKAQALSAALAPILRNRGESYVQALAVAAARAWPVEIDRPGIAGIRRMIETALERDAGREEWHRWEIYLPKRLSPESAIPARLTDDEIGFSDDAVSIRAAAMEDIARRVANGQGFRAAKAAAADDIETRHPTLSKSRESLMKLLNRDWSRWHEGGCSRAALEPLPKSGRPPLVTLNEEELKIAGGIYVKTQSGTMALRRLAQHAECREKVADAILKRRSSKHTLTPTLRAQLKNKVPAAVMSYHRSPTRMKREGFINHRTLTYLDKMGKERDLMPGDLFERDDMSQNFLLTIDWPWGGDPCSDKYGVRLARGQLLPMVDVRSLFFPSFTLLVRLRDRYRADDIWQWVGQTYRDTGMPVIGERWERGIWQAHQLQGTPIAAGHTDQQTRLGGLKALGVEMIVSQSPTTKIIENRFRYLQRVQSTIPGQIGAKRGEFEAANKLWTACRNGQRDPRDHFLSHAEALKAIEASFHDINSEPVEGTLYHGIPANMWRGAEGRMRRLTPEQTYLFSRDRRPLTVNKGHVISRFKWPDGSRGKWVFHHPELWRHEGRRVLAYMDAEAAQAGATLVFADGRDAGQMIGHAAFVEGCPQFALGLDFEGERGSTAMVDALGRRKDFTSAVRAEYRALGVNNTIASGSRASDGVGRSTSVEQRHDGAIVERRTLGTAPKRDRGEELQKQAYRAGDFDEDEALAHRVKILEGEAADRGEFVGR